MCSIFKQIIEATELGELTTLLNTNTHPGLKGVILKKYKRYFQNVNTACIYVI